MVFTTIHVKTKMRVKTNLSTVGHVISEWCRKTEAATCEFCEISKNTFPYRTPPMAASGKCTSISLNFKQPWIEAKKRMSNCEIYFPLFSELQGGRRMAL